MRWDHERMRDGRENSNPERLIIKYVLPLKCMCFTPLHLIGDDEHNVIIFSWQLS